LLDWIDAEDPALATKTRRAAIRQAAMPRIEHTPSFTNYVPALKPFPQANVATQVNAMPPRPVATFRAQTTANLPAISTRVRFTREIASRLIGSVDLHQLIRSSNETPIAARFRIAVSSSGQVRFCFLDQSSGDAALDEQARIALLRSQFTPNESPNELWTVATFEWGNDIAPPNSDSSQLSHTP
jgi:TonB family protein